MTDEQSLDETEQKQRDMNNIEYWIDSQQKQIDDAKNDVESRRNHIGNHHQNGLLDGDFVSHRDNEKLKNYLQGYADALEFASERIESIDNLVKYAGNHADSDTGHDGGESDQ